MRERYDWIFHGHNPDVGTSEEDIWSPGGSLVYPTAASVAACVSSDVDDTNTLTDEIQSLYNNSSTGDFTITFDGAETAAIAWNAADTAVKAALELLSTIGTVGVTGIGTVGDPWLITFTDPGGEDVAIITTDDTGMDGSSTIAEDTKGIGAGARKIMLRGWLQTTWELSTEVVQMDGTTPVNSVKLWERILSGEVVATGRGLVAEGNIDISLDSGKVQQRIEAGTALSSAAICTIPVGYHGQVTSIRATKDGTDLHTVKLYARRKDGLTFLPVALPLAVDNDRQNVWHFDPARSDYMRFGAETDLVLRAVASGAGDDLDAAFDITLVRNRAL